MRKTKIDFRLGFFYLLFLIRLKGCPRIEIVTKYQLFRTEASFWHHVCVLQKVLQSDTKSEKLRNMQIYNFHHFNDQLILIVAQRIATSVFFLA